MKKFLGIVLLLLLSTSSTDVLAQKGGIGIMPREDLVKLRATVRDSFSVEVYNRILDLKRYLEQNQMDSVWRIVAHNGGAAKSERWARPVSMQTTDESARGNAMIERLRKLFATYNQYERKYYAVFVDKDNPMGQHHLYQIEFSDGGKRKQMVSFDFYPIGELMMLGDVR